YRDATLDRAVSSCQRVYEPAEYRVRRDGRNGDGKHAEEKPGESSSPGASRGGPPPLANGCSKPAPENDPVHLTDRGNGMRLVRDRGHDLRHCWPWHKWLVWDGSHWRVDPGNAVVRDLKHTVVRLFRWAEARVRAIGQQLEDSADA